MWNMYVHNIRLFCCWIKINILVRGYRKILFALENGFIPGPQPGRRGVSHPWNNMLDTV